MDDEALFSEITWKIERTSSGLPASPGTFVQVPPRIQDLPFKRVQTVYGIPAVYEYMISGFRESEGAGTSDAAGRAGSQGLFFYA